MPRGVGTVTYGRPGERAQSSPGTRLETKAVWFSLKHRGQERGRAGNTEFPGEKNSE